MFSSGIIAFLISTGAVTLAEMGDKTQLLAMAFACKFRFHQVLIGVFVATILNHALAVALGYYLMRFQTIHNWVDILAALSFIFFGLWTLKGDKLEGEEKKKYPFGPIITVIIAFFIAEIGDKTQLATIALSSRFSEAPLWVLIGTTTGMMIADTIGIVVGVVMCKRIPEKTMKIISAVAFIGFGLIASFQVMQDNLALPLMWNIIILCVLGAVTFAISAVLIKNNLSTSSYIEVQKTCNTEEA